jgi:hypothetical protein
MNKNLVKWLLIFGGGFLGFTLFKPKSGSASTQSIPATTTDTTPKSFDDTTSSDVKPTKENAEIVIMAYSSALKNNEPQSTLNELNKECMKDYGMRCYMDKNNKLVACDSSGNVILSK